MKVLHMHAESEFDIIPVVKAMLEKEKPKKRIVLISTIQELEKLKEAKEYLEEHGHEVEIAGQALGCRIPNIKNLEGATVMYIGSGRFHPKGIVMKYKVNILCCNPETMKVYKETVEEISEIEKRKKGALMKFLSSDIIGVLFSIKSGQSMVQGGERMIEQLERKYPEKKFYVFAVETLDYNSLQDFPFIQCWINTMCPRIGKDDSFKVKSMINIEDIKVEE